MAMIPTCSVLQGFESVDEVISSSYGALSDGVDSVWFEGVQLSDTMPVNGSPIVEKLIFDGDFWYSVSQRYSKVYFQVIYQSRHPNMPLQEIS